MSSSSSETPRAALTPRLGAAFAASAVLHAALVGGLDGPGAGVPGPSRPPQSALRVALLPEEPSAAATPAAAGAGAPAAPRYYRTRELEVPPAIATRVHPEFPPFVHVDGKVVIRVFIDEHGTVEHVAVERAQPPGTFDASARKAFLNARFTPGKKAGVPVRSQVLLEVTYTRPRP